MYYMAQNWSPAYRDTNAAFGRAIAYGRGQELANIFKDQQYINKLKSYKQTLIKNQQKLNKLYDVLEDIFGKDNFDDNILNDLMDIMKNNFGDLNYDDMKFLVNSSFNMYSQEQQRALTNFLHEYWATKDDFLTIADDLDTINLGLAGSNKENQYYDIFLRNVVEDEANSSLEPINKLIQLTRAQYEEFEKVNPDLFFQSRTGVGLKRNVSRQEIYNRMLQLFPEEQAGIDILDQVYAQTNKNGQTYGLRTRDIYNILRKGGSNMISMNQNSGPVRLSEISQSRRLEMLFDNDLISNLQQLIDTKQLTADGKLQLSKREIQNEIRKLDFGKYKGENVYGGVAGDASFLRNGIMEEHQIKYKDKAWAPWNGQKYGAMVQNIDAYIDTGQKFINDPAKMNDLMLNQLDENQFFNFVGADAKTFEHFEEMGYQVVNEHFLSDMGDTIQIEITF